MKEKMCGMWDYPSTTPEIGIKQRQRLQNQEKNDVNGF